MEHSETPEDTEDATQAEPEGADPGPPTTDVLGETEDPGAPGMDMFYGSEWLPDDAVSVEDADPGEPTPETVRKDRGGSDEK